MKHLVDDVELFHEKMGIEYNGPPRELPPDLQTFRSTFLQEELDEYNAAVLEGDLEGALDALLDLIYVAAGTGLYHGFSPGLMAVAWHRVQTANLAKRGATSAGETKRGHSKDVVKPPGWEAPRFRDLIEKAKERWGEVENRG